MSEAPRDDDQARARAGAGSGSVLLEAPAGSGKTAVLTQRFLTLLARVDDPGEILAITFTRKAAAEMRARVVRALRGEIGADDPNGPTLRPLAAAALAHAAARGWRLAEEPQTLRIQTIDSFNFWLATQLPVAARVGGALAVSDDATELCQRAARATLAALDAEAVLAADGRLLFERLDNNWMHFERLLTQMLEQRGHWLRFVADQEPEVLCARVTASLAGLVHARLAALCGRVPQALRARAAHLPGASPLGSAPHDLGAWQHLAHLVLTQDDWRAQVNAHRLGGEFSDPAACRELKDLIEDLQRLPGLREALLELRRTPPPQLPAADAAAIHALARVLGRAARELHVEFAVAQRVDHTYVTGAARAALAESGEPTELALRTGLKLRHILVDEFQDTSLAQFQLLETLTAGWEPDDGRTLFVVGDPMQSIYRFRDAEVGLFLRARAAGIGRVGLEALRLTRNFRAAPALVSFANELFAAVFPAIDDLRSGAVAYRPSTPARPAPAPLPAIPPVSLPLFPDDRTAEADALATRVAALRAADPAGSIAVLVVAHAHATPVIEALAARGIGALGVDLVPLAERGIVRDLVSLTRALCDLADRTAWLAVLRAPWCGARLTSLAALSGRNERLLVIEALGDPERLRRCAADDRPRLERLHATLARALATRGAAPLVAWLEATWLRLGAADAYAPEELPDARAFFAALAARAGVGEWRGPADFETLLAALHSDPGGAGSSPVQVMTIHRAKGLEFDHVLLPSLDRATRGAERRLLNWLDLPGESGASELLMAPVPAVGPAPRTADLNAYLRELVRQRDRHEHGRLLYVAATRARCTVWLSGAPRTAADGGVKPDPRSLLGLLWPALSERFTSHAASAAARAAVPAPLTRLGPDWEPAPLPAAVPLTRLPGAQLASEPPEFSWVGETQRHIGTVVHAWLAQLAQQRELPAAGAIAAERAAVAAQLRRAGVPAAEEAAATDTVLKALGRTLGDERGRWILAAAHREARSEWELSGVAAGQLRSVKIDRSFVAADGTRWVIDYKTSAHEGGDLEGFVAREAERYRAQLEGYAELARGLGTQPVRAALYFPLLGVFREL